MSNQLAVKRPHFVLVPLMSQGHMIPMIDFAHLLASQGALVSVITTPLNASRIKTTIDRARESGLSIRFVELRFPCAEAGLPDGCENVDVVPSPALYLNVLQASSMLRQPLEQYLMDHRPAPSCIIADFCHPWTRFVARNFGVPRLTFFSICSFTLLSTYTIRRNKVFERVSSETEPFEVPGLAQRIQVTKAQANGFFSCPGWESFDEEVRAGELEDDGVVVNTCDALEKFYIESHAEAIGKKVWSVGPVGLRNRDVGDMTVRGDKPSIDVYRCLNWLDTMKPRSVVYVSFGSVTHVQPSQLVEIGLGLEASGSAFIWVIKAAEQSPEVERWLAEGFEKRTSMRGLIVKGWAPQIAILSHRAIGGLVTHCGWNSVLEAVSAGVPMITWPHFGDQFLNERFVVDVMGIGVEIGVKVPTVWGAPKSDAMLVKKDVVERAVRKLMDEEEAEERRKRVSEYGQKAVEVMKIGGSSYNNWASLVQNFSGK